jgi:hypothetical protein
MKRKIIQIAASAMPAKDQNHPASSDVIVLCDEGTVWQHDLCYSYLFGHPKWEQLPPIPQEACND